MTAGPGITAVRITAARPPLAVGALTLTAVGYLAAVDPNQPGHYPTCPFLFLTGRYCPGCGGLRAVHDLSHGDLAAAASANLLVVIAVPVLVWLWLDWTRNRLSGRVSAARFPGGRFWGAWAPWSLLLLVLIFWGLRNLPETSWLAP
jgi:hypothetical protein